MFGLDDDATLTGERSCFSRSLNSFANCLQMKEIVRYNLRSDGQGQLLYPINLRVVQEILRLKKEIQTEPEDFGSKKESSSAKNRIDLMYRIDES